jgi:ATP-binding cassette, subfamily B, bacterial
MSLPPTTASTADRPPWPRRLRLSLGQLRWTLALLWQSSPLGTLALVVLSVAAGTLPPLGAMVGKIIIDSVIAAQQATPGPAASAAMDRAIDFVLLELAVIASMALIDRALNVVRAVTGLRVTSRVNRQILVKALALQLHHFEDPDFYDQLTRARREASSRPVSLVQGQLAILRGGIALVGCLGLLTRYSSWMMLAVVLASAPAFVAEVFFSGKTFRLRNRRSPLNRLIGYVETVISDYGYVKEVKLFGLGPFLLERHTALTDTLFHEDRRMAVRRAGWGFGLSLLATLTFYGCYVSIVKSTIQGLLSLGDMALYLVTFRQAQQSLQSILGALNGMYEDGLYMSNLLSYLSISTQVPRAASLSPKASPSASREIRFEGVSFRYEGKETWAVRDIDVVVPEGQCVALVGENGAGKSTLLKLLMRLYQPTVGRILVHGQDLQEWDEESIWRRFTTIFQDFSRYQFTLRENVGTGSIDHRDDDLRLARALDRAGLREFLSGLPGGLETQLGRKFAGGIGLSGGQWQRIALARAFMREQADILILDEPTAAIDAATEHALSERFRALTRGRTTFLVSHRFSTVRLADRILLLEGGRIVEDGSHEDLLRNGALYARLFDLQARAYR